MNRRNLLSSHKEMGEIAAARKPKPIKSIGRDEARCYCSSCGRKRSICKCERSEG